MRSILRWQPAFLTGALAAMLLSACSDETKSSGTGGAGPDIVEQSTRFVGKVVDAASMAPLSSAAVELCGIGVARTDAGGRFRVDVDVGIATLWPEWMARSISDDELLGVFVRVEAKGYAAQEGFKAFQRSTQPATGSLTIADLGEMWLRRPSELRVRVSSGGEPLAAVKVYAYFPSMTLASIEAPVEQGVLLFASSCATEIRGVTDASGVATLRGLDPRVPYLIAVPPQDTDGDGSLDISGSTASHRVESGGELVALDVQPYHPEDGVAIAGSDLGRFRGDAWFDLPTGPIADSTSEFGRSSLGEARPQCRDEHVSFQWAITTPDSSVTLVFQTPVEVTEARFTAVANLVAPPPSTTGFPGFPPAAVVANTVARAEGTVWTFTPMASLSAGEVYDLEFFADGHPSTVGGLYRPGAADALTAPALDNYDGVVGAAGDVRPVYLEFAGAVTGEYVILSYTTIAGEVVFAQQSTSFYDDSMVFNAAVAPSVTGAQLGATPGLRYRVVLPLSLPSDAIGAPSRVTLRVTAGDAHGNQLAQLLTLPVR